MIVDRTAECAAGRVFKQRHPAAVKYIVVHRSGIGRDALTMALAYRYNKLYAPVTGGMPPYHYVIEPDGSTEQALGLDVIGAHCKGFNTASVGIACLGDFQKKPPTPAQWQATLQLCAILMSHFHLDPASVKGHDEFPGVRAYKQCPGDMFSMPNLRKELVHGKV